MGCLSSWNRKAIDKSIRVKKIRIFTSPLIDPVTKAIRDSKEVCHSHYSPNSMPIFDDIKPSKDAYKRIVYR
jgi:hypothetical protein